MHIHLPKGFHNWRELAKEVGIIVLGVLIALGFEQLVQAWRWREDVRSTRQSLTKEIENSALFAIERIAVQNCLRDRIAHLETKLNSANSNWVSDPMVFGRYDVPGFQFTMPLAYQAPHRPYVSDIWETAKATGVIDHMDQKEAHSFEYMFTNIDRLRTSQDEEMATIPQLSYLNFNVTMDPQLRAQSLVALERLDIINTLAAGYSRQILSTVAEMHLAFGPVSWGGGSPTFEAGRRHILRNDRQRYGGCVADVGLNRQLR
jgi:hypothetical protein